MTKSDKPDPSSPTIQARPDQERRWNRGLFSSPSLAWWAAGIYVVALLGSLTLTYEVYLWLFKKIGAQGMDRLLVGFNLSLVGILLGGLAPRIRWTKTRILALLVLALAFAYCFQISEVPANRLHLAQYTPLTFLLFEAFRGTTRGRHPFLFSALTVTAVGLIDESVQNVLPQRYFDWFDVALNAAVGVITLAFIGLVLGPENYPWPQKKKAEYPRATNP